MFPLTGTWWVAAEVMWATCPLLFFQACHWSLHYRWHFTDPKATSARSPWYSADVDGQQVQAGTRHFGEGKLLLHRQKVHGHAQGVPQPSPPHWLHLTSDLAYPMHVKVAKVAAISSRNSLLFCFCKNWNPIEINQWKLRSSLFPLYSLVFSTVDATNSNRISRLILTESDLTKTATQISQDKYTRVTS